MIASIIITNYNYGKYLSRCIRSCLNQNINQKFEIIVIDDNSLDNSKNILKKFSSVKNFRYFVNKKNYGAAKSANIGFKLAKGKYVTRVDADDFISNNFLRDLVEYLRINKNFLGAACDYTYIDKNGKKIQNISSEKKPIACGILYNKKKLKKYGWYNYKFRHREEEELRARIGKDYKIKYLNISRYRYRLHKKNKTNSKLYLLKYRNIINEIKNKKLILENKKFQNYFKKYIVAIIPAKLNSRRFKNKNISKFWGKPMIFWAINAAKKSSLINDVFVSSESEKILNISKKYGAKTIKRPIELSQNNVHKMDVIKHAVKKIMKNKRPYIVISLQANSPNIETYDLNKGIIKLIKYKKNEIISLDKNLIQNSAFRIMLNKTVFQNSLSTYVGGIINNAVDIHYKSELKTLKG